MFISNLIKIKPEKYLSEKELMDICNNNVILSNSGYGPKVIQKGQLIYKIFYRRKLFSKKIFFAKAKYFIVNSEKLIKHGIFTAEIQNYYYCKAKRADVIVYESLPGNSLGDFIKANQLVVLSNLARYLAELHIKGIFFKAIHTGNILLYEQKMALLDIDNISFYNKPLPLRKIIRNLKHLINHRNDKRFFEEFGMDKFFKEYFEHSGLNIKQQQKLLVAMQGATNSAKTMGDSGNYTIG